MLLVRTLAGSLANQSRISPYWSSRPVVYTFLLIQISVQVRFPDGRRDTILMLHPKRFRRCCFARDLVQIERGPAGARQKRVLVAELVRNMDTRERLLFLRACDHCLT